MGPGPHRRQGAERAGVRAGARAECRRTAVALGHRAPLALPRPRRFRRLARLAPAHPRVRSGNEADGGELLRASTTAHGHSLPGVVAHEQALGDADRGRCRARPDELATGLLGRRSQARDRGARIRRNRTDAGVDQGVRRPGRNGVDSTVRVRRHTGHAFRHSRGGGGEPRACGDEPAGTRERQLRSEGGPA